MMRFSIFTAFTEMYFSALCKSFVLFSLCQNARMQFASDKVESPNERVSISLDAIHP